MIEARRPPALARIDVEADIAVADVDTRLWAGRLRRLQAEQRRRISVEPGAHQRVSSAHELAEIWFPGAGCARLLEKSEPGGSAISGFDGHAASLR